MAEQKYIIARETAKQAQKLWQETFEQQQAFYAEYLRLGEFLEILHQRMTRATSEMREAEQQMRVGSPVSSSPSVSAVNVSTVNVSTTDVSTTNVSAVNVSTTNTPLIMPVHSMPVIPAPTHVPAVTTSPAPPAPVKRARGNPSGAATSRQRQPSRNIREIDDNLLDTFLTCTRNVIARAVGLSGSLTTKPGITVRLATEGENVYVYKKLGSKYGIVIETGSRDVVLRTF